MTELDLLIALHLDGYRQGPGSKTHTKKALDIVNLYGKENLRIADIGCGTGAQTLTLASELDGVVEAVDLSESFLQKLEKNANKAGFSNKINTVISSMDKLPFELESFDLIWSEGAIYNMGFKRGLEYWKTFLKPGGCIAVSEISWIKDNPPTELQTYWNTAYPEMDTVENKAKVIQETGFELLGSFVLPEECWWDNYYMPLLKRIPSFLEEYKDEKLVHDLIKNEREEIDFYKKYKAYYSYGFYVARRPE